MKYVIAVVVLVSCCVGGRGAEMAPASKRAKPATRVMGLCLWTSDPFLPGAAESGPRLKELFGENMVGNATQKINCFAQPRKNKITRTGLYELLEGIPFIDADATCVFYYLGHGVLLRKGDPLLFGAWSDDIKPATTDTTFEHCLALDCDDETEKFVPRSMVRQKLKALGAGLVVFITDSCSDPFRHADSELIKLGPAKRNVVYEDLFLNSQGFVEINSSSFRAEKPPKYDHELLVDYQSAACPDDGAVFSNAFVQMFFPEKDSTLDTNKDGFNGWNEAFNHLLGEVAKNYALKRIELSQTRRLFGGNESNGVWLLQKTQSPMFFGVLPDFVGPQ